MAYTYKHGDRPLEGYTIQRGIGRGGFGEVYYAISDGGREVALKYLRENPDIELRGVTHCMNLKSPYLVSIFDVKKNAEGEYFIIMEHVAGPSLRELLVAESNGFGVEKTAFFFREIARGLAYLHECGIVHRDLKPANIFYENGHVKIGDYGLSKFISVSRHSAQTASIGTVHYMAPEVGSGNYQRGIDIYALGVMLYEMLLGKVPFEGSTLGEVLMKHLTDQPEVKNLPEPFGHIITRALEKDPNDRYQNVNEMIDDMLEVGSVRDSLAGFNTNTITYVPKRDAGGIQTPVPSPNPPPRVPRRPMDLGGLDVHPGPAGWPKPGDMPNKLEQRFNRVSRKVARKMEKLCGSPVIATSDLSGVEEDGVKSSGALQRAVLAVITVVGMAVGVGLLTGAMSGDPAIGGSIGMYIVAMTIVISLSTRMIRWLGVTAQPGWVQSVITLACAAPPLAVANAPVFVNFDDQGFATYFGLLAVVLFTNWHERVLAGRRGQISFGAAFSAGLFGLVTCAIGYAIFDGYRDEILLIGPAAAAAVSVVIQALAWFSPHRIASPAESDPSSPSTAPPPPPHDGESPKNYARRMEASGYSPAESAYVLPQQASLVPTRSIVARAFWTLASIAFLFGSLTCVVIVSVVRNIHREDALGLIAGAIVCFALLIFSLQKITINKRVGFWRETVCPFLLSLTMIGFGTCIAAIATNVVCHDEELALAILGIISTTTAFFVLLFLRLRRPRPSGHRGRSAFIRSEDHDGIADTRVSTGEANG